MVKLLQNFYNYQPKYTDKASTNTNNEHKQECEQQEDAWLWFVIVWGVVDIDSARSWRPSREAWQAV